MKKFEFIIPFIPPSVNKIYTVQRYNHKRRILTKEARNFKDRVKIIVEDEFDLVSKFKKSIKEGEVILVEYVVGSNWINKNGTNKKKDVMNFEKLTSDAIFDSMKLDDSIIWSIRMKKAHSPEKEFIYVSMTKENKDNFIRSEE